MRPIAAIVVALVAVLCATLVGACEQAKPSVTPSASVAVRASEAPAVAVQDLDGGLHRGLAEFEVIVR